MFNSLSGGDYRCDSFVSVSWNVVKNVIVM